MAEAAEQLRPFPDDVLDRCLACVGVRGIGVAAAACSQWRRISDRAAVWAPALRQGFCKEQYRTRVTEEGLAAWLDRELGGDIDASRGHLKRLQESRCLRHLHRYLSEYHNGVEAEPSGARRMASWYSSSSVSVTLTVEILNFWPHDSWVSMRAVPPVLAEDDDAGADASDGAGCGDGGCDWAGISASSSAPPDYSGCTVRIRCWDSAMLPPGRLGKGFLYLLDAGPRGELFRVPALSRLEIGCHRIAGHVEASRVRLEYAMGRWPEDLPVPLPACTRDAFLHTTMGNSALLSMSDDEDTPADSRPPIDESWLEGRPWPSAPPAPAAAAVESTAPEAVEAQVGHGIATGAAAAGRGAPTKTSAAGELGPALYRTTVDLDVSSWL